MAMHVVLIINPNMHSLQFTLSSCRVSASFILFTWQQCHHPPRPNPSTGWGSRSSSCTGLGSPQRPHQNTVSMATWEGHNMHNLENNVSGQCKGMKEQPHPRLFCASTCIGTYPWPQTGVWETVCGRCRCCGRFQAAGQHHAGRCSSSLHL